MNGATDASETLERGIRLVHEEAGGVLSVTVLMPEDLPEMLAHAILGNPEAAQIAALTRRFMTRIRPAPHRSMLCATCPRPLRPGKFAIGFANAYRDDPAQALAFGLCRHCAPDHKAALAAAHRALRGFWPDARLIDPPRAEGGRA